MASNLSLVTYQDIFDKISAYINTFDAFDTLKGSLIEDSGLLDVILQKYALTLDSVSKFEGLYPLFGSFKTNVESWESGLLYYLSHFIRSYSEALLCPTTDIYVVIDYMVEDMERVTPNPATVLENTVGYTVLVPPPSTTGTGSLVVNAELECLKNEVVELVCDNDNTTAGKERFRIVGSPAPEGSGSGSIYVEENGQLDSFEVWSGDLPSGWVIGDQAAGTWEDNEVNNVFDDHCLESSFVPTDVGLTSISKTFTVVEGQIYCVGVWIKRLTPTGVVDVTVEMLLVEEAETVFLEDHDDISASWEFKHVIVTATSSSMTVRISAQANLAIPAGEASRIIFDGLAVVPMRMFGYAHYALMKGPVSFVEGDRFKITTDNDEAGIYQTFFGKRYGKVLPSAAVPTISDPV